jgi:hypothetical protein
MNIPNTPIQIGTRSGPDLPSEVLLAIGSETVYLSPDAAVHLGVMLINTAATLPYRAAIHKVVPALASDIMEEVGAALALPEGS